MISTTTANLERLAQGILLNESLWKGKSKMTLLKVLRRCLDVEEDPDKLELINTSLRLAMEISEAEKREMAGRDEDINTAG